MGVPQEDGGCRKLPCDLFDTKVEIVDNGVKCIVDVKDGQETGFFLDQKYNRLAIQRLCKGAKVLDCFTHTGLFALNAGGGRGSKCAWCGCIRVCGAAGGGECKAEWFRAHGAFPV